MPTSLPSHGQKTFDPLSKAIIEAAIRVHRAFGPGLLEAPYEACLVHTLRKLSFEVVVQPLLPIRFEDLIVNNAYRPDMIVENKVIVEVKHVEKILILHEAQVRTYLRLTGITLGLLFNFNTSVLKNGIRRIELPRRPFPASAALPRLQAPRVTD